MSIGVAGGSPEFALFAWSLCRRFKVESVELVRLILLSLASLRMEREAGECSDEFRDKLNAKSGDKWEDELEDKLNNELKDELGDEVDDKPADRFVEEFSGFDGETSGGLSDEVANESDDKLAENRPFWLGSAESERLNNRISSANERGWHNIFDRELIFSISQKD